LELTLAGTVFHLNSPITHVNIGDSL